MSKLSSKLHKNKNNTDILIYLIYLPKIHENILKYYKSNLFKGITIVFNHCLLMTTESLASFSDGLLV